MSQLKLTADGGGGTVAIKGPASTTGNAALEMTVPSAASGTLDSLNRAGNILQIVQTVKQDVTSIAGVSSGSAYTAATGLSATITPSSSSNKILISCNLTVAHSAPDYAVNFRLYKAGSHLTGASGTASGSREACWLNIRATADTADRQVISNQYLDTAGGTSAITYAIYVKVEDQSSGKYLRINTSGSDSDEWYNGRSSSNITLWEVAA